jgi:phage I-like protein
VTGPKLDTMLHPIALAEAGKAPSRIQIMRVGSFRWDDGEEMPVTRAMLESFVRNFDAKVRGYADKKLPIDYFHENEKLAAGWISNLAVSGDGDAAELWADVEWTPRAADAVANKELRYVSVEFHPDYKHNEGSPESFGPTLFGAGLTNRPFIKGMRPMIASEAGGKGPQMTLEQALAKIAELEAEISKLKGPAAMGAEMAPKLDEMKAECAALSEKVKGFEAERTKAAEAAKAREGEFTKLLSEGKVVEAQRAAFLAGDVAGVAAGAKALNDGRGTTDGGAGARNSGGGAQKFADAQSEVAHLAEQAMATDKSLTFRTAVRKVLSERAELNAKYRKEVSLVG